MKKMVVALAAVILIAAQVFTLAAAAPLYDDKGEDCGNTYTVRPNDNLYTIARTCGTSVSDIQALNPQIDHSNMVYAGQVLRLTETAPIVYLPTYTGYATSNGSVRVSVSSIRAKEGDEVSVYVSGFPEGSQIEYRVGEYVKAFSVAYEGTVDEDGNASVKITIPSDADLGEYWIIRVQTMSAAHVVRIYSPLIYISGITYNTTSFGLAKVSLSKTQAKAGDKITVTVSGFPANSEIDYRVGEYGKNYSAVYDGTVDSNGNTSGTITIPSSAEKGKYWFVHVQTTSHVVGVDVNSSLILIIE